ncbi:biotin/lipoyl-containing protein [Cryobacterium sp. Y50]|uniref:biotin/lipoyl-containing protein n=1 Tax=Cryobacterium sp. Y50 TaxID=2048286 RepID=UPI001304FB76|nr:biotin/lipoyl-containing protein [Cryobacterium sp. Y50]
MTVPKFGVSTDSIGIVEWLKEIGDEIRAGEPVVLVETDKATIEIEATTDGVLFAHLAEVGDNLDVGEPYVEIQTFEARAPADVGASDVVPMEAVATGALLGDAPEPLASPEPTLDELIPKGERPTLQGVMTELLPEPVSVMVRAQSEPRNGGIRATPSARALARFSAIDLMNVQGTAPNGRIRRADVEEHLGARATGRPVGAERWTLTVTVPLGPLGGAATADVAVAAAVMVLGRKWPNWQAIRVRDDDDAGLVIERRMAERKGTNSDLTWTPAGPVEIQQPGCDITFIVSEVAGLAPTLPVALGIAILTIFSTIGDSSRTELGITFDPERFSSRDAYVALNDVSSFVASPHKLIGELWDRSRP